MFQLSPTLFLLRHGETRLTGTFCGSTNPPLSRRGREQAKTAGRHLSRIPIHICYVSPLLRAQQTAEIAIRDRAIPRVTQPLLKELHFGAWEGLRFSEIEKKWPELAERWARNPMRVRIPHAETFALLRRRIKRFLGLKRKQRHTNVLIVAHGGSLSALVLELLGLPDTHYTRLIQPPGSVRMIDGQRLKALC